VKVPLGALNGGEVEFDLPSCRISSVAIPKGVKPGEMIIVRVKNGTGNGEKAAAAAAGKAPKKRWDSLRPATAFPRPSATTTVTAAIAAPTKATVTKVAAAMFRKTSAMARADGGGS
jgi:hypothetical protein